MVKNRGNGFVANRSTNLDIQGWIFRGNGGRDISSKISSMTISDSTFINSHCEKRCSINLYAWDTRTQESSTPLVELSNNEFRGYSRAECPHLPIIEMDRFSQKHNSFSSSIRMRQTTTDGPVSLCQSKSASIDAWINDADGSLRPQGLGGSGQGTLLTDMPKLLNFVDPSQCQASPSQCSFYCNTCFRSIILSIGRQSETYRMKVCLASDHGNCVYFGSYTTANNGGNTRWAAHLPPGKKYVGHLVNESGEYVNKSPRILMGPAMCEGGIELEDFALVNEPLVGNPTPAPTPGLRPTPSPPPRPTSNPVRDVPEADEEYDDGYETYDDDTKGDEEAEEAAETDNGVGDDEEDADEEEEKKESCKGLFCGMGNK